MSIYWLTPVRIEGQKTILGAGRIALEPEDARDRFLFLLKAVNPGMLLLFKSHMLLSEEAEAACGVDELPFELDYIEEPIIFGQDALELSHCAEAYLGRLPNRKEMTEWLDIARLNIAVIPELDLALEDSWLKAMQDWVEQGNQMILLREDD
ncbi:hypothetical protein [Paenibacillus agricola]|uniref:Uncharacterized protein n=1 Tax=Paenibacillus agricola TaxID=2716264 RepID=A0ABX0J9R1_9BACL|nr:hypothetical protein [Paenibacillus agricola]NHN30909.1 hypothetical protein [Paenibacillus agricola]